MKATVFDEKELADLMGYERIGDVEKKLREQGIRPIYGKPGHFFVTSEMINHAAGVTGSIAVVKKGLF
jgi:hypothetical protein